MPEAAKRIKTVCGATVSRIMIESDAIWHAIKKPHHQLLSGDVLHFVSAVNTATNVRLSDKDHQSNKVLILEEDRNGIITFLAEVRVNGEWVAFMDCWRQRKSR